MYLYMVYLHPVQRFLYWYSEGFVVAFRVSGLGFGVRVAGFGLKVILLVQGSIALIPTLLHLSKWLVLLNPKP